MFTQISQISQKHASLLSRVPSGMQTLDEVDKHGRSDVLSVRFVRSV